MKKLISLLLFPFLLTSCGGNSSPSLSISYYANDVSGTAPTLLTGLYEGEKVDYVLSSYPVIASALLSEDKKTDLSIVKDIRKEFGEKYHTEGFPQAGLFIKASLEENQQETEGIQSFLSTFDQDIQQLISQPEVMTKTLSENYKTPVEQKNRYGFTAALLEKSQENNGLGFLNNSGNPSLSEFKKFETPLSIQVKESSFSTYYQKSFSSKPCSQLSYSVLTPLGAPSASFIRYGADEKFETASPSQVSASFVKQDVDFIIFDAVNGMKLSEKNNNSYRLVRMVTFGNLYLLGTGNDEDQKLSEDDVILGFGENLIPDLAFKAVYQL